MHGERCFRSKWTEFSSLLTKSYYSRVLYSSEELKGVQHKMAGPYKQSLESVINYDSKSLKF
jgi:hypothetical protein